MTHANDVALALNVCWLGRGTTLSRPKKNSLGFMSLRTGQGKFHLQCGGQPSINTFANQINFPVGLRAYRIQWEPAPTDPGEASAPFASLPLSRLGLNSNSMHLQLRRVQGPRKCCHDRAFEDVCNQCGGNILIWLPSSLCVIQTHNAVAESQHIHILRFLSVSLKRVSNLFRAAADFSQTPHRLCESRSPGLQVHWQSV